MIWAGPGTTPREASLNQWTGGAQQGERKADGGAQQAQNLPGHVIACGSAPRSVRRNRKQPQTEGQKGNVEERLADGREAAGEVGVEVAEQQRALEKDQARGPNCGAAPKPPKNQFGEERFEKKKKKSAQEDDGRGEKR